MTVHAAEDPTHPRYHSCASVIVGPAFRVGFM
jgi:hypothetical protein